MNIAQIKQLEAVDGWIDFSGEIIEIKETKSRTKKNRLMQKVKLKDETGEIGAWIYADGCQHQLHESITANGMLKEYEDHRYIDYATVKQSRQVPPQNAQQTPQQAAQRPNGQNKQPDTLNTSIERQAAFTAACHRFAGTAGIDRDIIELAKAGHYFIETGKNICDIPRPDKEITNPDFVGYAPPPPPNNGVPF